MRRFARLTALAAACVLAGCNTLGPRAVEGSRVAYNEVLARTQSEQLLLNLVRLRYVDVPVFLEVSSVNTQFEFRTSASAGISGELNDSLAEHDASAGLGFSVVEKPTVSYVPLQGDAFVKQIMAPIDLDTIVLMSRSGWSAHRLLQVCAQGMCGLPNAPAAAGPAPDYEPEYEEFLAAVTLMRMMQHQRAGAIHRSDDGAYVLRIDRDFEGLGRLRSLTGLVAGSEFPIRAGAGREANAMTIEPRSLLGAMFYLGQGIDVPEPHAEAGWAVQTPGRMGQDVTEQLFHVRSARSRPATAAVSVRYRGWWFYVDDADVSSKATFAMLSYLFAIQSGGRDARGPALTIGI